FRWQIGIPPNTTADVYVPAHRVSDVTEGKTPASRASGVRFLRQEEGYAVFAVGAGTYLFSAASR
ncbi:MAG TPA: hypothetical protein VMM80_08885, partial [Bacteroidota bacterium]|nr:hypothetical protein [Bacteroidota bacterium]